MKKVLFTLMCIVAMLAAGTSLKAQEVTVVLNPGWTWISFLNTDTLDFATAFGSFTPAIGDIAKSKWGQATYIGNGQWRGSISELYPGYGYHYYSNRTEPVTFTTGTPLPQVSVTTTEPADITGVRASVSGIVTIGEGNHVFVSGVCWSTEEMPTVDDNHKADDLDADSLSVMLYGLAPSTTYYVRAYAVTDYGLVYGNQQSFTTLDWNSPTGAIDGLFSVSENQQVYFSQGNLQYQASTNTWRFADNQYDYIGSSNYAISSIYSGWIDLFGWGTSGYNHGANSYQPWSTKQMSSDYYVYGSYFYNLYDQTGQADWGYNPISNGGNTVNQWRTLTRLEWNYVFNTRNTASGIRYAKAKVNGVNGVILLPDDWNCDIYNLNNTNSDNVSYSSNALTVSQWTILENAGAVFLPAAGYRFGTSVGNSGSCGYYWSASYCNNNYSYVTYFSDSQFGAVNSSNRSYGQSVRVVCAAE